MKEITHCKYSLFLLEKEVYIRNDSAGLFGYTDFEECCILLETFGGLEQAKIVQKEYKQKTIILTSY